MVSKWRRSTPHRCGTLTQSMHGRRGARRSAHARVPRIGGLRDATYTSEIVCRSAYPCQASRCGQAHPYALAGARTDRGAVGRRARAPPGVPEPQPSCPGATADFAISHQLRVAVVMTFSAAALPSASPFSSSLLDTAGVGFPLKKSRARAAGLLPPRTIWGAQGSD